MMVFSRRIVRQGNSRWVQLKRGHWVDLGQMSGDELVKWCFLNAVRLPDEETTGGRTVAAPVHRPTQEDSSI